MIPPQPRRIVELDGLRGIAIGLVLWEHMVKPFIPENHALLRWLRAVSELSWSGVDLFFVLSGFFIGGILIDNRLSPRLGRVFYIRRGLRILPVYYMVLLVIGIVVHHHYAGAYNLIPFWVYAIFACNIAFAYSGSWDYSPLSVSWSLAIEEQFYLIAPWVVRTISVRSLPWVAGSLALLAWTVRAALLLIYPKGLFASHLLMPLRMDTLALGMLVAWMVRSSAASSFFHRMCTHWHAGVVGCGAVLSAALARLTMIHPETGSPELCIYGYGVIAVSYALVVAVVAIERPPALSRLLSSVPLVRLGMYSYFIYLAHPLIKIAIVGGLGGARFTIDSPAGLGIVLLALGATWGAAALSWRYIESPLISLGHRLAY